MNIALDIIVLVIIIAQILNGRRKGLVKTVISMVGILIALVLAFLLARPIGMAIGQTFIAPPMRSTVISEVAKQAEAAVPAHSEQEKLSSIDLNEILENIPESVQSMLKSFNVSMDGLKEKTKELEKNQTIEQAKNSLINSIIDPIANGIGMLIAYVLLFIIFMIAIKILSGLSGIITKLPVIKQLNKSGGAIAGFIYGLVTVILLCSIINLAAPLIQKENTDFNGDTINKTVVFKHFYNFNPLKFISSIESMGKNDR